MSGGLLDSLGRHVDQTGSQTWGVAQKWNTSWHEAFGPTPPPPVPFRLPSQGPAPPAAPPSTGQQVAAALRRAQQVVGAVMGFINLGQDMLNVGFANLTNPIAQFFPSLPASTIGSLYVGMPHAHSHPPSLIPPAPPVPLPSIGAVLLGTHIKTLINYMPAARCGDIGVAFTCVGFFPFFQIKTGSSNVFIGGNRAARMLDICQVCTQADDRQIPAGKFLAALGKMARGALKAIEYGGYVASGLGIAANVAEAAVEDDAAMSSAKALAAAMDAAQMAADIAAKALTKSMGKDPGIPPGAVGALLIGMPNVLIGGFPMINIPNPLTMLLEKLSRFIPKPKTTEPEEGHGPCNCPK